MTEQEINNLIDSKIGKTKMSQLPEATQTSGLYSIGYNGNQSVKYKANLLQGDPLTVRKTYQTEVEALADKNPIDPTTSLPLTVGQFVSIVDDGEKNGIYRIGSISGDGTMSLELQGKLGDMSEYANHGYESNPKTLKEVDEEKADQVDLAQLAGDFNFQLEEAVYNRLTFSAEDFAYGVLFSSGNITWDDSNKTRIATIKKYPVKKGDILKSSSNDVKVNPIMYDSEGEWISQGEFEYEHIIEHDGYIVVYARLEPSANISDISSVAQNINILNNKLTSVDDRINSVDDRISSVENKINIVDEAIYNKLTFSAEDFAYGISQGSGNIAWDDSRKDRIATINKYAVKKGYILKSLSSDVKVYPIMYDSAGGYISEGIFEYEQTIQFDGYMVVYARLEPSAVISDISSVAQNINVLNNRISSVDDKINSVENKVNSVDEAVYDRLIFSAEDFAYGTHNDSGIITWEETSKRRIATINKYPVEKGYILKSLSNDIKVYSIMYDSEGEFISSSGFEYEHIIEHDGDMVIYARLEPDAAIFDISSVTQNISVINNKLTSVENKINIVDDRISSVIDNGTVIVSNDEVFFGAKKFLLWNPYKEIPASPIKIDGQLHAHTSQSDGGDTAETVASIFAAANYKFWTITDHNRVTPKPSNNDDLGLIWIGESYESTNNKEGAQHMCIYMGELETYDSTGLPLREGDTSLFGVVGLSNINKSMNQIIEHYATAGNLISYAHPFWAGSPQTEDKVKSAIAGIGLTEVHNQITRHDDAWDWQLQEGRKVFGIAVDDYHNNPANKERFGWVEAWVTAETKQEVLKALFTGCFVAVKGVVPSGGVAGDGMNGITITSLSFINGVYSIQTDIPCTFKFINQTGLSTPVKTVTSANSATYELSISDKYVRCEISADSGVTDNPWIKWTQPVFVIGEKLSYEIK